METDSTQSKERREWQVEEYKKYPTCSSKIKPQITPEREQIESYGFF